MIKISPINRASFNFCSFKDDKNNDHSFYEIIKIIRKYISQIKDINSTELKKTERRNRRNY